MSGLQRSAVSAIVDQLIEEGWVSEGAADRLGTDGSRRSSASQCRARRHRRRGVAARRSRPSDWPASTPASSSRHRGRRRKPPRHSCAGWLAPLRRCGAHTLESSARVWASACRDASARRAVWSSHRTCAGATSISRHLIESAVGLPVVLENAANACALAELWFGRHTEDIRHLLAVTVSEGIGVGMLVNGQLVHGGQAMAGEFGHITIDEEGPPCPCGKRGCWERYASNSAAVQHYVHGPSSEVGDIPRFEDLLRFADHGDRRASAGARAYGSISGVRSRRASRPAWRRK